MIDPAHSDEKHSRSLECYEKTVVMVQIDKLIIPKLGIRPCHENSTAIKRFLDTFKTPDGYGEDGRLISVGLAPNSTVTKAEVVDCSLKKEYAKEPFYLTSLKGAKVLVADGAHRVEALRLLKADWVQAELYLRKDDIPFQLGDAHTIGYRKNDLDRKGRSFTTFDTVYTAYAGYSEIMILYRTADISKRFAPDEIARIRTALREDTSIAWARVLLYRGLFGDLTERTVHRYVLIAKGLFRYRKSDHVWKTLRACMNPAGLKKKKGGLSVEDVAHREIWDFSLTNSEEHMHFLLMCLFWLKSKGILRPADVVPFTKKINKCWAALLNYFKEHNVSEDVGLGLNSRNVSSLNEHATVLDNMHKWYKDLSVEIIGDDVKWGDSLEEFLKILEKTTQWPGRVESKQTSVVVTSFASTAKEARVQDKPKLVAAEHSNSSPQAVEPHPKELTSPSSEKPVAGGCTGQSRNSLGNENCSLSDTLLKPRDSESPGRPPESPDVIKESNVEPTTAPLKPSSALYLLPIPRKDTIPRVAPPAPESPAQTAIASAKDLQPTVSPAANDVPSDVHFTPRRSSLRLGKNKLMCTEEMQRSEETGECFARPESPTTSQTRLPSRTLSRTSIPPAEIDEDVNGFAIVATWDGGFSYKRPKLWDSGFTEVNPDPGEKGEESWFAGKLAGPNPILMRLYEDRYLAEVTLQRPWRLASGKNVSPSLWKYKYSIPGTRYDMYIEEAGLEANLRSIGIRPPHQAHWRLTIDDFLNIRFGVFRFLMGDEVLFESCSQKLVERVLRLQRKLLDSEGYLLLPEFLLRPYSLQPGDDGYVQEHARWTERYIKNLDLLFKHFDETVPAEGPPQSAESKLRWSSIRNGPVLHKRGSTKNARWTSTTFATNTLLETPHNEPLLKARCCTEVASMILLHLLHLEGDTFDDVGIERKESRQTLGTTDSGSKVLSTSSQCDHQLPHRDYPLPPEVKALKYPQTISRPAYFWESMGPEPGQLWILPNSHKYASLSDEQEDRVSKTFKLDPVDLPAYSTLIARGDLIHAGMGAGNPGGNKCLRLHNFAMRWGITWGDTIDNAPQWSLSD